MEFDGIDNLSEEEIFQLYIDVVDSDESYMLSAQTCRVSRDFNGCCDKWCENPTAHYYYCNGCK